MQSPIRLHHFAQRAINSKAHARCALVGLDVNITGAIARCLRKQRIEHTDDGRIILVF